MYKAYHKQRGAEFYKIIAEPPYEYLRSREFINWADSVGTNSLAQHVAAFLVRILPKCFDPLQTKDIISIQNNIDVKIAQVIQFSYSRCEDLPGNDSVQTVLQFLEYLPEDEHLKSLRE